MRFRAAAAVVVAVVAVAAAAVAAAAMIIPLVAMIDIMYIIMRVIVLAMHTARALIDMGDHVDIMKVTVLASHVAQAGIDMADLAMTMDIGDHIAGIALGIALAWLCSLSSSSWCLRAVVVVSSSVSLSRTNAKVYGEYVWHIWHHRYMLNV